MPGTDDENCTICYFMLFYVGIGVRAHYGLVGYAWEFGWEGNRIV
jgi:hypothetical protein